MESEHLVTLEVAGTVRADEIAMECILRGLETIRYATRGMGLLARPVDMALDDIRVAASELHDADARTTDLLLGALTELQANDNDGTRE